jgi:hypothetical protein
VVVPAAMTQRKKRQKQQDFKVGSCGTAGARAGG